MVDGRAFGFECDAAVALDASRGQVLVVRSSTISQVTNDLRTVIDRLKGSPLLHSCRLDHH